MSNSETWDKLGATELWDKLGVTDPKHTKAFNRAGGFKGTAIKPQWVLRRLTEEFGPCGKGWGVYEPTFQVVPVGQEVLVYCTVTGWYGTDEARVVGVGGDKVAAARSSGVFTDDEAFKKAFTDAIMNAFKFIGVGADVHMGLFDDSKYVAEAEQSFTRTEELINKTQAEEVMALLTETKSDVPLFLKYFKVESVEALPSSQYGAAIQALRAKQKSREAS